ncbi:MAG: hypothetical protein HY840_09255 [Bacteroidetes bacterium]|nr:hypothetical protein [Bacteroidota bacterium]
MRTVLIIMMMYIANAIYGQITPYVSISNEKQVRKDVKQYESKQNRRNGYIVSEVKYGDTLTIKIIGIETIVRKLTFDESNHCDFDQIIFSCDSCALAHVDATLKSKEYKWKKISENKYLSKYFWRTELALTFNVQNFCSIMTFKPSMLAKEEYKKMYEGK